MRVLDDKYAINAFAAAPDPAGGAYSAPSDPLAGFKGTYLYRKGKAGEGREGKAKGHWKRGRGRERKGASRYFFFPTLSTARKASDLQMYGTTITKV